MNWNIQTELPMWLVPIGLGLAVLLSWLSYYTPKAKQLFPKWARILLISLRSLTLLFLFFLFLGPKIISRAPTTVKPVFLLAVDNSASMKHGDSNASDSLILEDRLPELQAALKKKFDVFTYLFGDHLRIGNNPDFSDKATDFSLLFQDLTMIHHADPVNGLLVISDGIFNQGLNPLYAGDVFPFPVYTLGMGDTTKIPDLRITEVTANDLVYKDTRFPVEMIFESLNLADLSPRVKVSSGSVILLDTTANFFPGDNSGILRFNLEATKPGVQYFRINISGSDEETNLRNNVYTLAVEVVEHKARILILFGSPHPDVSAINSAIGEMNHFELESSSLQAFTGRIKDYDLVIFHQVPGTFNPGSRLLQEFKREQIPAWFILGGQSNIALLNQLDLGVRIGDNSGNLADIGGNINKKFSLFKVADELEVELSVWPPLKGPLSSVRIAPRTEVLLNQKIKSIPLEYPLLCFTKTREGKNAFLLGEGIWRWRLSEYLESGSNDQLNALINSVVQYLVIEEDRDQFRLQVPKSLGETEKLTIRAQVYNESLEDLSGMIVSFKLVDSANQVSNYEMRPALAGYTLVLDPLKPGRYSYTAETNIGPNLFTKQGQFFVLDVNLEDMFSTADFQVLEQLAMQKEGRFFTKDQYDNLLSFAKELEPGEEFTRTESKWIDLLQLKYLLFLLFFC